MWFMKKQKTKTNQWLVCKRCFSFLWYFQGKDCVCPSARTGVALEHGNKSKQTFAGCDMLGLEVLMACWEKQIRPPRTITGLAQTVIKCHCVSQGEMFDCLFRSKLGLWCAHRKSTMLFTHLGYMITLETLREISGEKLFCLA